MKFSPYRWLRVKLATAGLLPRTRLARFTSYLAGVDLLFYLVQQVLDGFGVLRRTAATLGGWVTFLTFIVLVLGVVLGLKWVRRHLMWRLRNRLIVTYVFIGVIPVFLLVSMALIAGWLFVGQFATYVATADLHTELNKLDAGNSVLVTEIAAKLRTGTPPAEIEQSLRSAAHRDALPPEFVFWYGDQAFAAQPPSVASSMPPFPGPPGAASDTKEYRAVAATRDSMLHLRVARHMKIGNATLSVVSGEPLDNALLARIGSRLGKITLEGVNLAFDDTGQQRNLLIHAGGPPPKTAPNTQVIELGKSGGSRLSGGMVPPPVNRWDREVGFGTPLTVSDWRSERVAPVFLVVNTRVSQLYGRLFLTTGDFSRRILQALIAIAITFGVIELVALIIGVRLTRSMTRSVAELYTATEHINRGQLRHRIRVKSYDQLAALERSFNSMAQSLEKLIAEQKEKQRIENELAIAQEVQAQLFPKQLRSLESLEVHGLCRPARTVSGDYYDFLALGHDELGIAVGDVSGKGISAALLMATIHSAVRAYTLDRTRHEIEMKMPAFAAAAGAAPRFADANENSEESRVSVAPSELLSMLNRQLFHSTPMEKYATLFFGVYDGSSRRLTYTNAGHLPPIVLAADGSVRRLEAGGTVAGLFDNVAFEEATVELNPGDIFITFSDGVTEPENEYGEFGEQRLMELVRENRGLPLDRISEAVTTAVRDWIGGAEQPDDITLVLARAR